MNQKDHTPLIVICITILASLCAAEGGWLLWKGFAGGGELVMTVNTAIAGLVGFLARGAMTKQGTGPGDTNVAGNAALNVAPTPDTAA